MAYQHYHWETLLLKAEPLIPPLTQHLQCNRHLFNPQMHTILVPPQHNPRSYKDFYFHLHPEEKAWALTHVPSRDWGSGLNPGVAGSPWPCCCVNIRAAGATCQPGPGAVHVLTQFSYQSHRLGAVPTPTGRAQILSSGIWAVRAVLNF